MQRSSVQNPSEPIVKHSGRPKGEKRHHSWGLLLWVVGILLALGVLSFALLRPGNSTYTLRSYETATVQTGSLTDYVRGAGSVVPRLERPILASAEGTLTDWFVAEGDEVAEGTVIGTLTSPTLRRSLADAKGEVEAAQLLIDKLRVQQSETVRQEALSLNHARAVLEAAQAEVTPAQKLFGAGAISKDELDMVQQKLTAAAEEVDNKRFSHESATSARNFEVAEAQLKLEQAKGRVTDLASQEAQLTLTAPVSGRVMKLAVPVGQAVASQSLLATVASSQSVRVLAKLPESQANRISVGQKANLDIGVDNYSAQVVQISPNAEASQNGPVVAVSLSFDESPQQVRIGASSAVEIEVDRKDNALLLPRDAFLTTGGERFVYLVKGDTAVRTNVTFGLIDGESTEVIDGLGVGDKIVSSSYEAFKDKPEIRLAAQGEVR